MSVERKTRSLDYSSSRISSVVPFGPYWEKCCPPKPYPILKHTAGEGRRRGTGFRLRVEGAHGTSQPLVTGLITLLILPLSGLIGATPSISRVIIPVISTY